MKAAGIFVFSDGGLDASTAVCSVDPGSGSPLFTDGPFARDQGAPRRFRNTLNLINDHPLLAGIKTGRDGLHAYSCHSFQLATQSKRFGGGDRLRWTGDRDGWGKTTSRAPSSIPKRARRSDFG